MATERYLPAGTRVLVRNPHGTTQYHTTKADIVFGVTEPETVRCPDTGRQVRSVTRDGYRSYFPAEFIKTRVVPDPVPAPTPAGRSNVQASLLFYDIPEGATDPDGRVDADGRPVDRLRNPTWFLRRVGVRLNLSCWAVPDARIQSVMTELHRLTRAGADWNVIPFNPGAGPTILAAVVKALNREARDAADRMPESAASMDRMLADTTDSPEKAEKAARRRADAVVARTAELVADLEEAAAGFGIDPRTLDLARTTAAAEATKLSMHERARLYYEAAVTLREQGGTGAAMAAALTAPDADRTTVLVAADALDDAEYGAGAALRAAFDDAAVEVPAGAGDVYDLPTGD